VGQKGGSSYEKGLQRSRQQGDGENSVKGGRMRLRENGKDSEELCMLIPKGGTGGGEKRLSFTRYRRRHATWEAGFEKRCYGSSLFQIGGEVHEEKGACWQVKFTHLRMGVIWKERSSSSIRPSRTRGEL